MRHRRIRGRAGRGPGDPRRPAPARVPRLRLGRHRRGARRRAPAPPLRGQAREPGREPRRGAARRRLGRRAHPLGHPRPADRGERAPAPGLLRAASWSSTTASSRTTSSSRRASPRPATASSPRPTPRWWRTSSSPSTEGSLEDAVRAALAEVQGVYALVLLHRDEPHRLVAARMGPPLVIGLGEGEHFVASDIPALLPHTRDFLFLEDGDVATVTPQGVRVTDPRRRGGGARAPAHRLGPGAGGEGRLPPLHAQGDPRAAAGGAGHAPRADQPRGGRGPPRGARARGGAAARGLAGRAPRLRHELARRPRRQVPDRAAGRDPGRGRLRQRVPLPDPARRARHGGGGDQPERRDRRHPRRVPRGEGARAPCPSPSATCRAPC